jgi:hypothetical protein
VNDIYTILYLKTNAAGRNIEVVFSLLQSIIKELGGDACLG